MHGEDNLNNTYVGKLAKELTCYLLFLGYLAFHPVSFNSNLAPEEWTKWNLMWNPLMAQLPLAARGY